MPELLSKSVRVETFCRFLPASATPENKMKKKISRIFKMMSGTWRLIVRIQNKLQPLYVNQTAGRFNTKMPSYQYIDSHYTIRQSHDRRIFIKPYGLYTETLPCVFQKNKPISHADKDANRNPFYWPNMDE